MGGDDLAVSVVREPSLKYHPCAVGCLTLFRESGQRTVLDGQFDWGGFLLKSNGGVQRWAQRGWQSRVECKGTSPLNCEIYTSSRYESRP